ncbi:MAG: purine-nucleoside phosphorylase [Isosphaeraceae bacterium]
MMTVDDEGLYARVSQSADAICTRLPTGARMAVILGSGLGALAENLAGRVVMPFSQIPHFPKPTVAGHSGNVVAGFAGDVPVLFLQGRFHYYEGHSLETVTFPVRVLRRLGVEILILTAATGGINQSFRTGEIVVLTDHLNLIGGNPLRGVNDDRLGPRFVDMSAVYSSALRSRAHDVASGLGITLKEGVYACLPGPSYETPAEIRMLRTLGADIVGMSTVPEALVARQSGMEVLAFALVTNEAAGVTGEPIGHKDVLERSRQAVPSLGGLIEALIARLGRG